MSIETSAPLTPLESAVRDLRVVQREYDEACEYYRKLNLDASEARVVKDAHYENLIRARDILIEEAAKPSYDSAAVRVVPAYLNVNDFTPRLEEGVDAAWSEKGPEA